MMQTMLEQFHSHLESHCKETSTPLDTVMNYSLQAGGKRVRPLLLLSVIDAYGLPLSMGMDAALAVEMIHTYSLIHDDLPSMDNDELRRGMPTSHIKFGEANAILAGDGLLTDAFYVLSQTDLEQNIVLELIALLSNCAGSKGMVYGQYIDINQHANTMSELDLMHYHKTGKLIEYSILAGALITGVSQSEYQIWKQIAYNMGLVFQIKDDILDVTSTDNELGKNVGSDEENNKITYVSLIGLEEAQKRLDELMQESKKLLTKISVNTDQIETLFTSIQNRRN